MRRVTTAAAIGLTTLICSVGGISPGHAVGAPSGRHANANFRGKWLLSNGQDFTVKKENPKTGACEGVTSLSSEGDYKFVGCKVKGHNFKFKITDGPGYTSYNSGTFSAHALTGNFHDTNGDAASYTATRRH